MQQTPELTQKPVRSSGPIRRPRKKALPCQRDHHPARKRNFIQTKFRHDSRALSDGQGLFHGAMQFRKSSGQRLKPSRNLFRIHDQTGMAAQERARRDVIRVQTDRSCALNDAGNRKAIRNLFARRMQRHFVLLPPFGLPLPVVIHRFEQIGVFLVQRRHHVNGVAIFDCRWIHLQFHRVNGAGQIHDRAAQRDSPAGSNGNVTARNCLR